MTIETKDKPGFGITIADLVLASALYIPLVVWVGKLTVQIFDKMLPNLPYRPSVREVVGLCLIWAILKIKSPEKDHEYEAFEATQAILTRILALACMWVIATIIFRIV